MTITVHLFAAARDLAGSATATVTLNDGATVAALQKELVKMVPALATLLPRCAIAVNQEFAAADAILTAADAVAVIPPVSGGSGRMSP